MNLFGKDIKLDDVGTDPNAADSNAILGGEER